MFFFFTFLSELHPLSSVCVSSPHQGDVGLSGAQGEIGYKGDKVAHHRHHLFTCVPALKHPFLSSAAAMHDSSNTRNM